MENSSPATMNQGQETDSDCEDKQREAALFLLQLKEKTKLQQSVINNVVEGVTLLFKKSVRRLKRKVTELLDSEGLSDIAASDSLQDLWRDEATPFEGLETNHLQEQYMDSTFPCVVGVKTFLRGDVGGDGSYNVSYAVKYWITPFLPPPLPLQKEIQPLP